MRSLVALLVFMLTVLGTAPANAQSLLTKGLNGPPISADPVFSLTFDEVHFLVDVFEGLTTYDRDGKIVLAQAESYEVSEDGLEYTFTLREGIVWSDGHPVDAEDFAFAVRRLFDTEVGPSPRPRYVAEVLKNAIAIKNGELPVSELGVEALDTRRIKFTLESPAPFIVALLGQSPFYPVPKHKVEELGDQWAEPENIVSNGAYLYAAREDEHTFLLKKNPHYRDPGSAFYDEVHGVVVGGPGNLIETGFSEKTLDLIVSDYAVQDFDWLMSVADVEFLSTPVTLTRYLLFNKSNEKLADPRVKWAISMAIERDVVVDFVRSSPVSNRRPAYALATPSPSLGWDPKLPDWASWSRDERVAKAREYMEELGYSAENPLEVETHWQISSSTLNNMSNALKSMLKDIHVDMTITTFEHGTVYSELLAYETSDDFMIVRYGFNAIYDNPQAFYNAVKGDIVSMDRLLKARGDDPIGARYSELVEMIPYTNKDDLPALFDAIEEEIWNSGPFIPLFYSGITHPVAPWIDFGAPNFNKLVYARHMRPS